MAEASHGVAPVADGAAGEAAAVARRMADGYARMVAFEREHLGETPAEAEGSARRQASDAEDRARILATPADRLSWWALSRLVERDPDAGQRCWEAVKAAARDDLAGGHRAGVTLEHGTGSPWERARFLAIREALLEEWRPRGGMERTLLDTMAQAQACYLFWLERLHARAVSDAQGEDFTAKKDGHYQTPRISAAEAEEQAAAMMDRFNRLFLRTLRALRDLRRYAGPVIVQQAGQVNIGDQQVNVAPHARPGKRAY